MRNRIDAAAGTGYRLRLNGVAVRVLRESLGVTAADLAKRAGLSPGHLSRLERGSRQTGSAKIASIAGALQVPREAISHPDPWR